MSRSVNICPLASQHVDCMHTCEVASCIGSKDLLTKHIPHCLEVAETGPPLCCCLVPCMYHVFSPFSATVCSSSRCHGSTFVMDTGESGSFRMCSRLVQEPRCTQLPFHTSGLPTSPGSMYEGVCAKLCIAQAQCTICLLYKQRL